MKMKTTPEKLVPLLAGAFALLFAAETHATVGTTLQMQLGNPSGATVNTNNHDHYLIQRTVEAMDYSDNYGESTWVSWDLTSPDMGAVTRSTSFYTDTNLPPNFYRVKTSDYTNSGYDRGHMCPSEDRTDTTNNNKMVFFMSNIVPQKADLNQGPWASFENYCQSLANSGNEILLITGPSSFSGALINTNGPVNIPGYTWKIAVVVPPGSGTALSRINTSTRVIAVKMPNVSGIRTVPWNNYVTSANQIQADTGYTFFTALSSSVAQVLRAKVDGAAAPSISSFSPSSGSAGTAVTITGANFTGASSVLFNGASASFTVNSSTQITATAPAGVTSGPITVITPGGQVVSSSSFTVASAAKVVISQVYGGGGNSGATYKNDFIELYNSGTVSVDLSTYAVQYASSTGTTWQETTLSGTLLPGHYYLIQEAAGTGGTVNLPTPQAIGTIAMAGTAGKVALTKTQTLLSGGNPIGNANLVDFVGYGTADAFEGSGAAPAPSNTTSDLRAKGGATDTNNNASDFATGAPNPRNN